MQNDPTCERAPSGGRGYSAWRLGCVHEHGSAFGSLRHERWRNGLTEQVANVSAHRFVRGPVPGVIDIVLEVVQEFVGGRIPLVWITSERLMKNLIEPLIDALIESAKIRNRHGHHPLARFLRRGTFEDIAAKHQVTEDHAGGEEIRAFVSYLKIRL